MKDSETSSVRTASAAPEPLTALASIGQELTAGTTLADGFRRAMRLLDQRLGAKRSALFIADHEQRTLSVAAAYGEPAEQFRPRYGAGVAGRVAESGRPIVVPSVDHEPMALVDLPETVAWRDQPFSLVSVPIPIAGRSAGALSVYFAFEPGADFTSRLGVLKVVASLLAQALRSSHVSHSSDQPSEPIRRGAFEYANMIGTSAAMRQVYEQIGQVAGTSATALILGESGTGKELVAEAIHNNSERARQPFIKINAAVFPETLFESELFGHERGAFTGAMSRKKGRFELAQGGTLFLDEIGELPLSTQVKLLRVLQSREFERLGGTETLRADVRLIAATNKSMEQAILNGVFREDLYYRLNVFTIKLPPLRERGADIPALAEHFLEKYAKEHQRKVRTIASGALDVLVRHTWPGNVRELENAIERAVVVCDGPILEERHWPEALRAVTADTSQAAEIEEPARRLSLADAVEQLERRMIEDALQDSKGNLARASRILGTTERILRYKVAKYGLDSLRARG